MGIERFIGASMGAAIGAAEAAKSEDKSREKPKAADSKRKENDPHREDKRKSIADREHPLGAQESSAQELQSIVENRVRARIVEEHGAPGALVSFNERQRIEEEERERARIELDHGKEITEELAARLQGPSKVEDVSRIREEIISEIQKRGASEAVEGLK